MAGTYTVLITDANGCTSECGPITAANESGLVEEDPAITDLSPNPATDRLNVNYNTPNEAFTIFEVKTLAGVVVFHKEINTVAGENNFSINTLRLANGTYYLVIYTESGVESKPFTVFRSAQ